MISQITVDHFLVVCNSVVFNDAKIFIWHEIVNKDEIILVSRQKNE